MNVFIELKGCAEYFGANCSSLPDFQSDFMGAVELSLEDKRKLDSFAIIVSESRIANTAHTVQPAMKQVFLADILLTETDSSSEVKNFSEAEAIGRAIHDCFSDYMSEVKGDPVIMVRVNLGRVTKSWSR